MHEHNEAAESAATFETPAATAIRDERRERWEARYREADRLWSLEPNPVLARVAAELAPGRALDLASGEGADAIWLASRGWRALGVDFAETAIERARAKADEHGVGERCEFVAADLAAWRPEAGAFDLVAVHYFHAADGLGTLGLLRELLPAAVAPGGTLLVVGHSAFPSWSGPARAGVTLPGPAETLESLELEAGEWEVVECGLEPRTVVSPEGVEEPRPDVVVRARRR